MKVRAWAALPLLFGVATALPAQTPPPAQALTLREALARADEAGYENRAAAGTAAAQRGQATAALRGILPSVRLEGGYVRTDDPIGAFGTTLRQRVISSADFDPARLNHPAAIGNYQGGAVLEQPLFNADAWTGRRAASRAVAAAEASADWTRLDTRVDVVRAYYGVTLAHEKVATLAAAARAAHAHVRQAEAMVREGLATKSDALLAAVGAGEVDAQLADAEAESRTALRRLALVLGQEGGFAPMLPDRLPSAARIRAVVAADTGTTAPVAADAPARADVEAARLGLDAARLDAQRARSLYLPRLNGFARYDWNSASRPYAGDAAWTVGVMASWSPFAGASEIAELQATGGRERAAHAMADAARERALLEVEESGNALRAALARLAIAERAVVQGAEAHRIVARKYEGGLATVAELLDAAATDTRSALALSAARYAVITAGAERLRASGRDPGTLALLEADAPVATPSR
jgi:outer membrane protein TolC